MWTAAFDGRNCINDWPETEGSSDDWAAQMLFFLDHGFRVIALWVGRRHTHNPRIESQFTVLNR
jgi:hypothetical protein